MDTAQFPPGEMLDDKYRIDSLLSVGGMGAVYVGTHTLLRKRVAIKVLRTELVNAIGMVERFQREAVAASAIGHENIVTVTDMGKTQGGVAFLVMELLEGRTLTSAIKDDGPLPISVACDIACEVLAGVAAAHRVGIVHRDLKPENVFLARRPGRGEAVKILDFGISSLAANEKPEMRLTMTGVVMGTPSYMAPEQARGDKEITAAADIYATAVILYEMLTKALPYEAENYNLMMFRVLSGEYVKPHLRRPDLPPALEAAVCRGMSLQPWDRFRDADEFAQALAPFRTGAFQSQAIQIPTGARKAVVAGSPSGQVATSDTLAASASEVVASGAHQVQPASPVRKRSKVPILVGAAIGVASVAVAIVLATGGKKAETTAAVEPAAQPPARTEPRPPPPAEEAKPPPPVQEVKPPPPAPAPIVVELSATPADATVYVNGTKVEGGRHELAAPGDIQVRVEAEGYKPLDTTLTIDRSKAIVLPALAKERRAGKSGRSAKSGGKKDGRIVTDDPYGD